MQSNQSVQQEQEIPQQCESLKNIETVIITIYDCKITDFKQIYASIKQCKQCQNPITYNLHEQTYPTYRPDNFLKLQILQQSQELNNILEKELCIKITQKDNEVIIIFQLNRQKIDQLFSIGSLIRRLQNQSSSFKNATISFLPDLTHIIQMHQIIQQSSLNYKQLKNLLFYSNQYAEQSPIFLYFFNSSEIKLDLKCYQLSLALNKAFRDKIIHMTYPGTSEQISSGLLKNMNNKEQNTSLHNVLNDNQEQDQQDQRFNYNEAQKGDMQEVYSEAVQSLQLTTIYDIPQSAQEFQPQEVEQEQNLELAQIITQIQLLQVDLDKHKTIPFKEQINIQPLYLNQKTKALILVFQLSSFIKKISDIIPQTSYAEDLFNMFKQLQSEIGQLKHKIVYIDQNLEEHSYQIREMNKQISDLKYEISTKVDEKDLKGKIREVLMEEKEREANQKRKNLMEQNLYNFYINPIQGLEKQEKKIEEEEQKQEFQDNQQQLLIGASSHSLSPQTKQKSKFNGPSSPPKQQMSPKIGQSQNNQKPLNCTSLCDFVSCNNLPGNQDQNQL